MRGWFWPIVVLIFAFAFGATLLIHYEKKNEMDDDQCVRKGFYECGLTDECVCSDKPDGAYFVMFLSSVALLFTGMIIAGFLTVKELRKQPGDFFFGFALAESVMALTTVVEVILSEANVPLEDYCGWIAGFRVLARRIVLIYHSLFTIYYLNNLSNSLIAPRSSNFLYHILPWVLAPIFTFTLVDSNAFGKTVQGTCELKVSPHYEIFAFWLFVSVITPVLTFIMIRRIHRRSVNLDESTRANIQYYQSYFILANLILLTTYLAKVYGSIVFEIENVEKHTYSFQSLRDLVFSESVVIFIDNTSATILCIIRMQDPRLQKHWNFKIILKRAFTCYCCRRRRDRIPAELEQSLLGENIRGSEVRRDGPFINQVQGQFKDQVISSLLASFLYYLKFGHEQVLTGEELRQASLYITNDKVQAKLAAELEDNKYPVVKSTLTIYEPALFEQWRADNADFDLEKSFDFAQNYRNIKLSGKGSGKSGAFFFFSNDNQFLIKTITEQELDNFLQLLPDLTKYLGENPNSLIAKIYAVFTYDVNESVERFHFIMQKNVNGYPNDCLMRAYDLKGSTVNRYVDLESSRSVKNGKDQNFIETEKNQFYFEDGNLKEPLLEILKQDSIFLSSHGLMDYSLIVYVVNPKDEQQLQRENYPCYNSIKAKFEEERGGLYYYQLGVIDYLTTYDWKKRLEHWFKVCRARNINHDISCQNPEKYHRRFIQFLEKAIFPNLAENI